MRDGDLRTRWLRGAVACAGLGAVAGALETVGHAASLRLPIGPAGLVLIGAVAILLMAALAVAAGAIAGIVHLAVDDVPTALAAQMGLVSALLGAWYLEPAAAVLLAEGRVASGVVMGAAPLGVALLVAAYARFLLRRVQAGSIPVAWWPASGGLAALLVVGGAAPYGLRDTSAHVPDGRDVVVVTVDGLRHDTVFGDGAPLGAWASGAIRFREAVTPVPASRPASATVLTSLHPLRHEVLSDDDVLERGWTTLATILDAEQHATAAFVSSSALGADSGLAQGFRVYDDAVRPGPRGLWLLTPLRRLPLAPAHRAPSDTVAAFAGWLDAHATGRFAAWIQLDADPTLPDALSVLDAALAAHGVADRTLVIVASTYGTLVGEHDASGLWDPVVRVPLLVRAPGLPVTAPDVTAQVRLMDVTPTVLAWAGLPALEPSEGVDLLGYATGNRRQPLSCTLVSPDGALVGLRNNGLKYVRDVATGHEALYDLASDPGETHDLGAEQVAALAQARGLVVPEQLALERLSGKRRASPRRAGKSAHGARPCRKQRSARERRRAEGSRVARSEAKPSEVRCWP